MSCSLPGGLGANTGYTIPAPPAEGDVFHLLEPTNGYAAGWYRYQSGVWIPITSNVDETTGDVLTDAQIQAVVGAMVTENQEAGINLTYDGVTQKINTSIQTLDFYDIVGGMVSNNIESGISVAYDGTNHKLNFTVTGGSGGSLTTEEVQDIVGGMVSGSAQTNITVSYNDATGKLDFAASAGGGGSSITLPIEMTDVSGLVSALNGKAAAAHVHTIANVTNLQSTLDDKAATSHNHSIAEVTNLQSTLNTMQGEIDSSSAGSLTIFDVLANSPSTTGNTVIVSKTAVGGSNAYQEIGRWTYVGKSGGTVKVRAAATSYYYSDGESFINGDGYGRVYQNGTLRASASRTTTTNGTSYSSWVTLTLNAGDVISFQAQWQYSSTGLGGGQIAAANSTNSILFTS